MFDFFNYRGHGGKHRRIKSFVSILLVSLSPCLLFSQISQGGKPVSFGYDLPDTKAEIKLATPDLAVLKSEDTEAEKEGLNRRVGVAVNAGLDVIHDGEQITLPDGRKIWRLAVSCENALAVSLNFDRFSLPDGYRMFAYTPSHDFIIGAYTLYNNKENLAFSTELIPGDRVIIEINGESRAEGTLACHLSDISYVYRDLPGFMQNRASSGDCEVNINCQEGQNWQYQKHGVARIYVRDTGGYFWCTGSLVNNTRQDNTPFFLTADHCAPDVTDEDLDQWIFYFDYEYPGCENQAQTPQSNTLGGAEKLARASTSGSDFLLIRMENDIPPDYNPFFNGWSIENIPSPNGVTIHHPVGDVKKISTYTQPLTTSHLQWGGINGTHWEVFWTPTESGWGVTEGGSSGSPLFDNTGRLIGTLTGGESACEPGDGMGPDRPDYYGKFSYSWDQNGSESYQQLKYWLDPDNTGLASIPGKFMQLTAAFNTSTTITLIGGDIEFTDLSSGLPESWQWYFEGGNPENYYGEGPVSVNYPGGGLFDVRLIVSDGNTIDTLLLKDYIHIVGKVYPNPTSGMVNIYIEEELPADITAEVFSSLGLKVYEDILPDQYYPLISIDLSTLTDGIYILRLKIKQRYLFAKVMVKH